MTHWSKRLVEKRKAKGWSAAELARRSDVDVELIYQYQRGNVAAPRGDTLKKLATALSVSELWLVYGAAGAPDPAAERGQILGLRKIPIVKLSELSPLRPKDDLLEFLQGREEFTVPDEVGPRAVAVRLDDHSMAPQFAEGSLVVCDPDAPIVPGKYVIAISNTAKRALFRRFKSLSVDNDSGELVPENPDFPTIPIKPQKDGFIVGPVVMLFQRL